MDESIEALPCIKCGSSNIDIGDSGYSSFNVAWGKCEDCGHMVTISPCSCSISETKITAKWNRENDPHILQSRYLKQINNLKKKLDNLPL